MMQGDGMPSGYAASDRTLPMTLVQLRCFVAIADAGFNITRAAAQVHASQPGLSRQLRQLEDGLGLRLFARRGKALSGLTPAGEAVLAHARRVLAEAANIRDLAARQRGDDHGQLIIATTHTQARFVLPPAIARIHQRHPRLGLRIEPSADTDVLARLARGEADLAVVSSAAGNVPGGGIAVPLFRWQRRVLVPAGHPLAAAGRVPELAQLAALPLVSYESAALPESSLRRAFSAAGLEPRLAMTARDADLIKTYVRAGLGVGLVAEMAVSPVQDADLASMPAPAAIPGCVAWAVLPRERVLRDATVELLLALAPQLDRHDLRRAGSGGPLPDWPPPPDWAALTQVITS